MTAMEKLFSVYAKISLVAMLLGLAQAVVEWTPSVDSLASKYNVPGGYLALKMPNGTDVVAPDAYSCIEHARLVREPYTSRYWRRTSLDELGNLKLIPFGNWNGNITQKQFYKALSMGPVYSNHYKIIGGQLYANISTRDEKCTNRMRLTEDMIRFAMYLYPLPDMEFLIHFRDGCLPNAPIFTMNGCRQRGSFWLMPSYMAWHGSMGQVQMVAYHTCLRIRYPIKDRIPKVIWRGSTTGNLPGDASGVNMENCMNMVRVRLHMLSRKYPDLLDVKINNVNQLCAGLLKPIINDTGSFLHPEAYNKYCVILDVDGNGWSDRFAGFLVHYPTVILKQSSNFTGFADYFFAPGATLEEFDESLEAVVPQARQLIKDCQEKKEFSVGQALAHRSQETAREVLDHVGVARSMAYGLLKYKRLTQFPLNTSLEGFERVNRPFSTSNHLPFEVIEDLKLAFA